MSEDADVCLTWYRAPAIQAAERCFIFRQPSEGWSLFRETDRTKTERLVTFFWQENNMNYLIAQSKKFQSALLLLLGLVCCMEISGTQAKEGSVFYQTKTVVKGERALGKRCFHQIWHRRIYYIYL